MTLESESPMIRYIKKQNLNYIPERLPLIYITNTMNFRDIMLTNQLPAKKNDATGRKEFRFFYGRPAAQDETEKESWIYSGNFPICLIAQPGEPADIFAMYPFDSNDYRKKVYKPFINPDTDIQNFSLGKNNEISAWFVSTFFGGNQRYCDGAIKEDLVFDSFDLEARQYHQLARALGHADLNDRRYTVEIRFDRDLEINDHSRRKSIKKSSSTGKPGYRKKGSDIGEQNQPLLTLHYQVVPMDIVAIVIPNTDTYDPQIRSTAQKWHATLLPYQVVTGRSQDFYEGRIFEKVMKFYEDCEYLEAEEQQG